jgi:hypothetical protein
MMARAAGALAVLLAALGGPAGTPFPSGERLLYQVGWMDLVQVATAELSATRTARAADAPGWHFQAEAHTQGAFRLIYTLDDRFDSYADAALRTRRYEQALAEQGRQVRRVSGPQAARDPLALLFYLRTVDWRPATVVRMAAFDGLRRWQVEARAEALTEAVTVPAGQFTTVRLALVATPDDGGAPLRLRLWLARDGRATPVRIDAEAPVGSLRGVLAARR